jgi:hypothetical protein
MKRVFSELSPEQLRGLEGNLKKVGKRAAALIGDSPCQPTGQREPTSQLAESGRFRRFNLGRSPSGFTESRFYESPGGAENRQQSSLWSECLCKVDLIPASALVIGPTCHRPIDSDTVQLPSKTRLFLFEFR